MLIEMTELPPSHENLRAAGYMNAVEAAKHLGVCVRTVRSYVDKGLMRPTQIGLRRHLFAPEELKRVVKKP